MSRVREEAKIMVLYIETKDSASEIRGDSMVFFPMVAEALVASAFIVHGLIPLIDLGLKGSFYNQTAMVKVGEKFE
jgi:hypothetical protein